MSGHVACSGCKTKPNILRSSPGPSYELLTWSCAKGAAAPCFAYKTTNLRTIRRRETRQCRFYTVMGTRTGRWFCTQLVACSALMPWACTSVFPSNARRVTTMVAFKAASSGGSNARCVRLA